ncbi:MAG: hydrogenase formation protein HypD [Actinobacteria bacterium RBG_19FT_COMBO_54_7]|nr:MAG: hydrogenase formation protein HypD [Actinobacteria bacterium RBG_19FT_COMBO_54_7]
MKYVDEFRSPQFLQAQLDKIAEFPFNARFMEVCGTHTMAISKAGLRPLLAPKVELVSGPGCPVCVTSAADIGLALALAEIPDAILATFGDMMRVPGPAGTLSQAAARGAAVKIVYSPLDALEIAVSNPNKQVAFLGVGFETTAPAVAAVVLMAEERGIDNFHLLSLHKLVPPALKALVEMEEFNIDGFILPGHVSAVLGSNAYTFLPEDYGIPCVIAGFEAVDILQAICELMVMRRDGAGLSVEYSRVVRAEGNPKALDIMHRVFEPADADWRGLGVIPGSGLRLREEFTARDAASLIAKIIQPADDRGCRCGEILCGKIRPAECPLFAGSCTPDNPFGPCMVSTEGTCASYYLYDYTDNNGVVNNGVEPQHQQVDNGVEPQHQQGCD